MEEVLKPPGLFFKLVAFFYGALDMALFKKIFFFCEALSHSWALSFIVKINHLTYCISIIQLATQLCVHECLRMCARVCLCLCVFFKAPLFPVKKRGKRLWTI